MDTATTHATTTNFFNIVCIMVFLLLKLGLLGYSVQPFGPQPKAEIPLSINYYFFNKNQL